MEDFAEAAVSRPVMDDILEKGGGHGKQTSPAESRVFVE
jgi:hypothetical protein